jgi:enoyl-CoA hydratase
MIQANDANVLYEKKAAIAYVTVNRPKVLNALNGQTLDDLRAVFEDARDDANIRGVIMTGAGERAFIAGADINELARLSAVEAKALSNKGHALLDLIENLGKPVIAAVNGFALGGGCEAALACTIRLARSTPGLVSLKLSWASFRVTAERSGWPGWLARGGPSNLS